MLVYIVLVDVVHIHALNVLHEVWLLLLLLLLLSQLILNHDYSPTRGTNVYLFALLRHTFDSPIVYLVTLVHIGLETAIDVYFFPLVLAFIHLGSILLDLRHGIGYEF